MTERTRTPCNHPLCPRLVRPPTRFCPEHEREYERSRTRARREDPRDVEHQRFYRSQVWRRLRNMFLRSSPVCVRCGQPGQVVDHIRSLKTGGSPLDWGNLQTLCHPCHGKKTAEERSKIPSQGSR